MKHYILDTSVAVKWFSAQGESDVAVALDLRQGLFERRWELMVPELFFIELANALRYNARFTEQDVRKATESLWSMQLERAELSSNVLREAVRLAYRYQITLYDAIFVALARIYDYPLVTADEVLTRKVKDYPGIVPLRHLMLEKD